MHLHDLLDPNDLDRGIADGLITVRESGDGQRILNYSDAAMFTDGAWDNPAVRQCRGLIIDNHDEVVARPWAKFFNHGQTEAGDLDLTAPVEVTDKLDGSLGIIHQAPDGSHRVATRGSFTSDQAIHATTVLGERHPNLTTRCLTPLVEIIYPANRIVCDYGDMDDLVLLGAVEIHTGAYVGPDLAATMHGWTGPVARTFPYDTLTSALAAEPRPGAEGLCVRFLEESRIVKIKQEDYVALHKIVTGLSERSVWQHMLDGRPLTDLLTSLPDELHDWTHDTWEVLSVTADNLMVEVTDVHADIVRGLDRGFDRRDYAEQAKQHGALTPWLFQVLDDRDPRPSILKTLKPSGDTRALARTEAVA